MARIRSIKPTFFSSISNAELPKATRLTWIGLWTYVDDKGRGVDDPRLVKAAIWPLDDDYTTRKIEADLVRLEKAGKIGRYSHDGRKYFAVVKWRHQRIDKPQPSQLPPAPWEEGSQNVPRTLPPDDGNDPGTTPPKAGGEVEGKGGGKESSSSAAALEPSRNGVVDDDDGSPISTTLALLTDRRIAAAKAAGVVVKVPSRYRRQVRRDVNEEFGDVAERMLCDGQSPESTADALMPVQSEGSSRYPTFEASDDEPPMAPEDRAQRLADLRVGRRVG